MAPLCIGTAFFHATGAAPNARASTEPAKFAAYYRCMVVFFASARRVYPDARLTLFCDRPLPPPFDAQLSALGVDRVSCTPTYVLDPLVRNRFPGCLYTLDVLRDFSGSSGDSEVLVLLDSDCIVRRRFDEVVASVRAGKVVGYDVGYALNHPVNGQTRASLALLKAHAAPTEAIRPIRYFGGEFYAIPVTSLPSLSARVAALWTWLRDVGVEHYGNEFTEEHVLNVVLASHAGVVDAASGTVKRIWTARSHSNVDGRENGIAVWHLPAEKERAFASLHRWWERNDGFDALDDRAFDALVCRHVPVVVRSAALERMRKRVFGAARVLLGRA